ncbi:hypothetical protein GCM10027594_01560 [Hymenobacter agri]
MATLPEFYKGYYFLEAITDLDGNNRVEYYHQSRYDPSFSHPVALQLLGRVAHLLGDMSVPAHVHVHLHPCPAGQPDYYENNMGGVWYDNNGIFDCEDDPGGTYPAQQWTAGTAAQTGGLLQEIQCMPTDMDRMRYLFYTTNQLADFFSSGVNEPWFFDQDWRGFGPSWNNTTLWLGNDYLPNGTNPYLAARYAALTHEDHIKYRDVANETFNFSIRAVASLFQWFSVNAGLMQDWENTRITATSSQYVLCAGGASRTFQLPPNLIGTTVTWDVQPSLAATGTVISTAPHTYQVSPTTDPSNGPVVVTATYSRPCIANPVTVSKALWKGLPVVSIEDRDPGTPASVEPSTSSDVIAQVQNEEANGTLTFVWTSDSNDRGGVSGNSTGGASVTNPRDFGETLEVTVQVTNECGTGSATRTFGTRFLNPGDDCLICPPSAATPKGENKSSAATSLRPLTFDVFPNPSSGSFKIQYKGGGNQDQALPTYVLLDALGRAVVQGILADTETVVDTHLLPSGLFLLQISHGSKTVSKRLMLGEH